MLVRNGDSGSRVRYIQYALFILEFYTGSIDSVFRDGTEAAVKDYQSAFGLDSDGVVGDKTWVSMQVEITEIQRLLSEKGFYEGSIDGVAGAVTFNALKNFQSDKNLKVCGVLNILTRILLYIGSSAFVLPLKKGDSGKYVNYLQYALHILCCNPGGIDGTFGDDTFEAVKRFQGKYSLQADGIVGENTWDVMLNKIKEIQLALIDKGYNVGVANGLAGPVTFNKILLFQENNNLVKDAKVGPITRVYLLGTEEDGANDSFPLKSGSKGTWVLYLQYGLRVLCCDPNGLDGVFGDGTNTAVKKFQSKNSLDPDGVVGTKTWGEMCNQIKPIQQALKNKGYYSGSVDGIVGELTYNAVRSFQADKDLTTDGMVGTQTKSVLLEGYTYCSGTTSATLKSGCDGSLVKYLQRMLNVLGYTLTIDGLFGDKTDTAVKNFQSKYSLEDDGIVGSATWSKLFSVYKVPVSGVGIEKFVAVAEHELSWGFQEDNSNNITPYGQRYGINPGQWCAMFVSWCAHYAGITEIPQYAYTPAGANWFKQRSLYYKRTGSYKPKRGDVVFFYSEEKGRIGHTGIVIAADNSYVTTIEGNCSDSVRKRVYSLDDSYIDGYGRNSNNEVESDEDDLNTPDSKGFTKIDYAFFKDFSKVFDILKKSYDQESALASQNMVYGFNKQVTCQVSPTLKLTYKIAQDNTLYNSNDNVVTYGTIKYTHGDSFSETINITDDLKVSFNGIEQKDTMLDVFSDISMTIQNGEMKCGVKYKDTWVGFSMCVTKTIGVTDTYKATYSYDVTIWVKNDESSISDPITAINECTMPLENRSFGYLGSPLFNTNNQLLPVEEQARILRTLYCIGLIFLVVAVAWYCFPLGLCLATGAILTSPLNLGRHMTNNLTSDI